ncbi:MAG: S-layer homology domain-containing protein [Clostridia bacterium]|nr:S-layer homology domain-containing protein [Clostridia bacterium]
MKRSNRYSKPFSAALLALFVLLGQLPVSAAVLGKQTSIKITEYSQGTVLYKSTFDDGSVGQQTEHYVAYTPNPDITPIITNGTSVYGKRTLTQANQNLTSQGIRSAIGMNGDFFSLQTGVPMSNLIMEKRVISKDAGWLSAIGFREDGTAFMGTLPISTNINTELGSIPVECINKYRQPYALYLFTKDFGESTYAEDPGINIVLKPKTDIITLNSSITAVVESVTADEGTVAIPEGKWVLSVSDAADQTIKDRIATLTPGTKVTVDTKDAGNDPRWETAVYAMGNTGGKLLTNGELDFTDEGAAPRSAIGIKKDGTIIFYTLDGRQTGYSYGARKETVAKRLLELGCVDAINLDGGGSTTLGGVLPGTTDFRVINSPSEGRQRSCANFFFLKKNNAPSGVPYRLTVSHWGQPVLSGASVQLTADAIDNSYGPAKTPADITYTLTDDADTPSPDGLKTEVTESGLVTVRGNGDVYIKAEGGGVSGSTMLRAVATPEEIRVFDTETGDAVTELVVEPGQELTFSATAYWGREKMIVKNDSFTWRLVSEDRSIGKITKDGKFTASGNSGAMGTLAVNAGLCTKEIPVRIRLNDEIPEDVPRPVIYGQIISQGLSASISCENSRVPVENIQLYLDGKPVAFNYTKSGILTYIMPEELAGEYHRLVLVATAENGAAAIAGYDWGSPALCANPFPDTKTHWARDIISYMAACNVVTGSSEDGSLTNLVFKPDDNMTRTEFAIMLCNYLNLDTAKYQNTTLPFTDTAEIPWWALSRVKAVYALGLMKGQLTDYGVEFKPNDNIKRMEYAISVQRLLPIGLAGAPITALDAEEIPFWAKESMKVATAQGILSGYPDGTLKPSRSVTRAEAVKILHTVFGVGK